MSFVALSVAGAFGAVFRYLITGWIQTRNQSGYPVGTLAVNLTGSLGLGLVLGFDSYESVWALGAIGFLGGFTTFSTWMIESLGMGLASLRAVLNLALTLLGGVLAALAGLMLTS
jgi:CrcB protein